MGAGAGLGCRGSRNQLQVRRHQEYETLRHRVGGWTDTE